MMKTKLSLFAFLISLIFFPVFSQAQSRLSESLGDFQQYETTFSGLVITATNGTLSLSAYTPDIIRVRAARGPLSPDFSYSVIRRSESNFRQVREQEDLIILSTDALEVVVNKKPLRLQFYTLDGKLLNKDETAFGISWIGTEVSCYKSLLEGERFIGLGEKNGGLDRRGTSFENWNTDDPAYGIDDDPLYVSTPFYMGLHNGQTYGIFLDNTHKTVFNFGASNDRFSSFSAEDGEMNYYFFGAQTVPGILEDYTWLTGRMDMPPLWSLGFQQSRWSYYPDSDVLNIASTFRDKKIPADVIHLDIHYMDDFKLFTFHPEDFSEPQKLIKDLESLGFHVVVIVDPGIKVEKGYPAYETGILNDVFVKYPDGEYYSGQVWPGWCHFPDFTDPRGREWWGKQFNVFTNIGIEGFWNDMNEPATWGNRFPNLVEFDFDGKKGTHREAHNIYGLEMARSTYEGAKVLLRGKRPFNLTRAAFSGIQRYSAVWTGDNVASDEHLMASVRLINSLGLAGIPFVGSDVGGFFDDPSSDLFVRWLSVGAFSPFFRGHSHRETKHQEPWAFGKDAEALTREYINTRYYLLPYIYTAFREANLSGLPVARSLAIYYPFDDMIYQQAYQNQYLFGRDLLVAPVESQQKFCKVYLPEGAWYRMDSDEFFLGKQELIVESGLDRLPVFVRAGAVLPMQSLVQTTMEKPSEFLQLHLYNGSQPLETPYYEDDGETFNYQKGSYYSRSYTFDPKKKSLNFTKKEGSYPSQFTKVQLVFHGFAEIKSVSVNDRKVDFESQDDGTYIARFSNLESEMKVSW
jgi:alpha-glucosidase